MAVKKGFYVDVKGVKEALEKAKEARTQLAQSIGREVSNASRRVVNEAKKTAPRKTGMLVNSIDILDSKPFTRIIGSNLPYAARQEYEHKTLRGFFRKALFNERERFRQNLANIIKRVGGE